MEALVPRPGHVLVESFPDDVRGWPLTPKSTLVAPGQYAESSRLSTVRFVGRGVRDVKPGDVVLSGRYPHSAWSFEFEGRRLVSIDESELLARIET